MINGVRVLRFPADQARPSQLRALYNDAHAHPHDSVRGRRWLDGVGPRSADLVKYIRTHALEYDVLCAIPYVFRTTLEALEAFPGPKVLIPCAHDEPAFGLDVYRQVFDLADATVFNTDEERQLIEERFGIRSLVTGTIGFPMPGCFGTEPSAFRLTNGVVGPYILYIGRIHPSKGCQTLLQYHQASLNGARDTTLVLMGTSFMDLSDAHNVLVTGFVDDQTKQQALAGASAIVLPSPNESLSIVALEAWAHARPVLATAESAVLVGQCERSSGGVWYRNESEFVSLLGTMLDFPGLATAVGLAGREWGNRVYDHRRVAKQWSDVLTAVLSSTEPRGPVG
jgi:glycosyltransferase involved in cell wall biosynthesis